MGSPALAWSRRASLAPGESSSDTRIRPWTAAKCHRLLRPIQARLNAIRQLSAKELGEMGPTAYLDSSSSQSPSVKRKRRPKEKDSKDNQPATKRARITYSQRSRQSYQSAMGSSHSTVHATPPRKKHSNPARPKTPGSLLIPTPMVRKIRSPQSSPCFHRTESNARSRSDDPPQAPGLLQLAKDVKHLTGKTLPTYSRPYQGLLRGLDSLLRHAAPNRGGKFRKSLTAMCLRQAHKAIEQLEEWQDSEDERLGEKSTLHCPNISFDVYSQLEALGGAGPGWKGLGEMVLAHAIGSICHAIEDGIIDFSVSTAMVTLTSQWQCFDAAAELLRSMLAYHLGPPHQSVSSAGDEQAVELLLFLADFGGRHGRWAVLFKMLGTVFDGDQVPPSWLCTKHFEPIWRALSMSLLADETCPWAMHFSVVSLKALTVLVKSGTSPDPRHPLIDPEQTLVRLLSGMAAVGFMACKGDSKPQGSTQLTSNRTIRRRLLCILECSLASCPQRPGHGADVSIALLAISACIASGGEAVGGLGLLGSVRGSKKSYNSIVLLISSAARQCSRGSRLPPHQHLEVLIESISGLDLAGRSIADITVDGAFLLAHKTCDLRDLSFAEGLPNAQRRHRLPVVEKSDTLFSGWKWDDGISEWVVCTPVAVAERMEQPAISSESTCLSPSRKVRPNACHSREEARRGHKPQGAMPYTRRDAMRSRELVRAGPMVAMVPNEQRMRPSLAQKLLKWDDDAGSDDELG